MLKESVLKSRYPERFFSPFLYSQYVIVNGIRTRYSVSGLGEPILLLHGFPENMQTWRHYAILLSKHFKVIAFDLKGFGRTGKPDGDYSPFGMADFVRDFMDAMKIESAYLVGSDISFTIACAFALRYPGRLKKLVLMAGTLSKEGIIAPEVKMLSLKPVGELILWLFGSIAIKIGLEKGFYKKDYISKEVFDEYYEPYKDPVAIKRTLELLRSFDKAGPELVRQVKKIGVPTLILWAQHERFFALQVAKNLNDGIKNSRMEIVEGCGHFIQEEKPEESANLITSFVRQDAH